MLHDRLKKNYVRWKTAAVECLTADLHWLRGTVQAGFLLFSILLGLQFRAFLKALEDGRLDAAVVRPAAVEGYLPISSLMSLVYFLKTGVANAVHPAGLVIFSLILLLTLLMRRGFCSWICPFGTASEWLYRIGIFLIGKNLRLPRFLDIPLQSLKYLLLGFFLYFIVRMPTQSLHDWIHGPYNRIADVKMYLFFFRLSTTAVIVFAVLVLLSVLIKNFWCRYLCPYGALLGLASAMSPASVKRDADACNGCQHCSRACPNRIAVHRQRRVMSSECTACYTCIQACNKQKALTFSLPGGRITLPATLYGVLTIAAFLFTAQAAQSAGYWHSDTAPATYRMLYHNIQSIEHPRTLINRRSSGPIHQDATERLIKP